MEFDIKIRTEADGTVYVWVPAIGMTVKGADEAEAMAKVEKALRHIMRSDRLRHLLQKQKGPASQLSPSTDLDSPNPFTKTSHSATGDPSLLESLPIPHP